MESGQSIQRGRLPVNTLQFTGIIFFIDDEKCCIATTVNSSFYAST